MGRNPQFGQSCDGGFSYLAAKWVKEFGGLTHEECYPYTAKDGKCRAPVQCSKPNVLVTDYSYIGGYYGATTEEGMMLDIVQNGPQAIGINVLPDFFHYKGGVYSHHSSDLDKEYFGNWEEINHAVVATGYGETPEGVKYWVVKNSWGKTWGADGYVLIERGVDMIGVESCAVSALVTLDN